MAICEDYGVDTIVLSGGVFQNNLLLEDFRSLVAGKGLPIWTNRSVPSNDGGVSLGQAALAAFGGSIPLRFEGSRKGITTKGTKVHEGT